jgi:PmbA protein
MSKELAQRILDMAASRADAAEVILEVGESRSVHFEHNRLKYIDARGIRGAGVRVLHRGKIGFSSTTDLDEPERVVRNAIESADFGQEARFEFPAPAPGTKIGLYDPDVPSFDTHRAIEIGGAAVARLLASDPRLDCAAGLDTSHGERYLLNTAGLSLELRSTAFDIGVYALRVGEDGTLTHVDDGRSSRRVVVEMDKHVDRVLQQLEWSRQTVRVEAGIMPVLFVPEALGVLLITLGSNVNGKTLQKGASLLAGRIGERVLDERITLWDDALVDYALGSAPFDGEGVPCRRLPIFEAGVFRNFVFDLQTAGMTGHASTGSAQRSFASQPGPGHHNIRLAPGRVPCADMLADMRRGVVVYQVLGAGQSNVLAGEFSVNVELGFLVENGKIVGRVKDAMLAGNAFEAFNNVADISQETEWHGALELPYVCFKGLSVVGGQG